MTVFSNEVSFIWKKKKKKKKTCCLDVPFCFLLVNFWRRIQLFSALNSESSAELFYATMRKYVYEYGQTMQDKLSESPRCNDMVADLHFPRFFCTAIQCEIVRRFRRSVVKVGLVSTLMQKYQYFEWVHPRTPTDLKLSYFNI